MSGSRMGRWLSGVESLLLRCGGGVEMVAHVGEYPQERVQVPDRDAVEELAGEALVCLVDASAGPLRRRGEFQQGSAPVGRVWLTDHPPVGFERVDQPGQPRA